MRKVDAAYWAGFLDGEGSFGLYKHKAKTPAGFILAPTVQAANTRLEIMQELKAAFGGYITLHKANPKLNRKPLYNWRLTSRRAMEVVKTVLPYLKLKTPQAELLLEAGDILRKRHENGHKSVPYPDRMWSIKNELGILNHRGMK